MHFGLLPISYMVMDVNWVLFLQVRNRQYTRAHYTPQPSAAETAQLTRARARLFGVWGGRRRRGVLGHGEAKTRPLLARLRAQNRGLERAGQEKKRRRHRTLLIATLKVLRLRKLHSDRKCHDS